MNGQSPPLSRTLKHLFSATAPQCEYLLHRCATTAESLPTTKKLHAHITTSGLLSSHFLSLLTSAYALCAHLHYACKLFDQMPKPTIIAYKAIIRMHTETGHPRRALQLFVDMHGSGRHRADEYTYPFVIRACRDLVLLELGMVVHGLTVKTSFVLNTFVGNSLIAMYLSCGDRDRATAVFDSMEDRTVVSWNTMISGSFRNGRAKEALALLWRMVDDGDGENDVEVDSATILSVLPACSSLKDLEQGRKVHRLIMDRGIGKRLAVQNALVDMYVKCGSMEEARRAFDGMVEKDVVTWTTMINGYTLHADVDLALEMCRLMQCEGVRPNEVTLASLLAMCAALPDLKLGKCLHGWAIRHHVDCAENVETALIDLYAKCNSFGLSLRVFSRTSQRITVPWNAILSGCIHNKMGGEAISLFNRMMQVGVKLDAATWKSLLPAYAAEADLRQASNIHSYLVKSGFLGKPDIITGMIDIYSKCGSLGHAHELFDGLCSRNRDIVSWSAIIAGYGKHGRGEMAVSMFNEMVQSGIRPNEVTFTCVLHACGHAGLVDEGLNLFNFMKQNCQECVRTYHYTCIVDLLGRAARLDEAYQLIKASPCGGSHSVWGALLGACVIHVNVQLGEIAARRLFELEAENTGNYVLLGNIYSAVGRFDDAERVRQMMNSIGLVKAPANSSVI
ncbi:pentatricopeptide repeat-containing protein At5g39350-like [Salvia hispanica]|uniref:pentatricopeptide repeat-containing protein At5g39350-like n=1 Tax=Salvia hispanica TaxID=49212 RepID=UPI0020098A7A|nr:pentatricopeptide repeat-containing protein At5g39350-like [Salvia hispanica]